MISDLSTIDLEEDLAKCVTLKADFENLYIPCFAGFTLRIHQTQAAGVLLQSNP